MKDKILCNLLSGIGFIAVLYEAMTPARLLYIITVNSIMTTLLYRVLSGNAILCLLIMVVKVYIEAYVLWHKEIRRNLQAKFDITES